MSSPARDTPPVHKTKSPPPVSSRPFTDALKGTRVGLQGVDVLPTTPQQVRLFEDGDTSVVALEDEAVFRMTAQLPSFLLAPSAVCWIRRLEPLADHPCNRGGNDGDKSDGDDNDEHRRALVEFQQRPFEVFVIDVIEPPSAADQLASYAEHFGLDATDPNTCKECEEYVLLQSLRWGDLVRRAFVSGQTFKTVDALRTFLMAPLDSLDSAIMATLFAHASVRRQASQK